MPSFEWHATITLLNFNKIEEETDYFTGVTL